MEAGEIHALMGENGAGKSTLLRILSGAEPPDAGEIRLDGRPVHFTHPRQAHEAGVRVIYQEFSLIPGLSVAENIVLADLPRRGWWVDGRRVRSLARAALERLGVDLPLDTPAGQLGVAQQQLVEIAKALHGEARLLIMDEPTASLTAQEIRNLFQVVRQLAAHGVGVIFVSHRLEEVMELADRVTVLRDGETVGTLRVKEASPEEVVRRMVGRAIGEFYPQRRARIGRTVLRVEGFGAPPVVTGLTFELREGEVLGLAGLVGAGRTETAEALFGLRPHAGAVWMRDIAREEWRRIPLRSPRDAIQAGIGYLPEDRKQSGLVLRLAVRDNMTHPTLERYLAAGFVRRGKEAAAVRERARALAVRTPSIDAVVENLSGGNQQKVVLGKWLEISPRVLILDEPTRGVDVGAKVEIYRLIQEMTEQGTAVILISSDIPELLALSDRLLVLRRGRLVAEIGREEATHERVLALCSQGVGA
ncbi:MAG: sugar ABC transporter ATP-binding protein [Firmicutes bacterium]|nr:sugar ABC transporter ATP-binding protein [Bacillota bacterium]